MIFKIFLILIGLYIIVDGVYSIIKGKNIGSKESKSAAKYTPESYRLYTRIVGVFQIIVGLALLTYDAKRYFFAALFGDVNLMLICGIVVGVCIVAILVLYFVIPKKRVAGEVYVDEANGKQNKNNDNDQYIDED